MTTSAPTLAAAPDRRPAARGLYPTLLGWAFAASNLVRVLTYLPTMWAIHESGRSDQHSLLAWCGCMVANLTMAAWIHEQNGRRVDLAVLVSLVNALLCGALSLVILWYR